MKSVDRQSKFQVFCPSHYYKNGFEKYESESQMLNISRRINTKEVKLSVAKCSRFVIIYILEKYIA